MFGLWSTAFRFAIRIDSIHLANRFELIRFPQKIATSDSTVLDVGVCQTTVRPNTTADTTVTMHTRAHHSSLISVLSHGADSHWHFDITF